jgi:hypothetical protein
MAELDPHPIAVSYWVAPGRLLAGEYPGAYREQEAGPRLRRLLGAGVTLFVDLTEEREGLEPYEPLLKEEAARLGVTARRLPLPIPDICIPADHQMRRILDVIDLTLDDEATVYVHCRGGMGRTGPVVGCYLVRHGLTGPEALARIKQLRAGTPRDWWPSPERGEQKQMVLRWAAGH